MARSRNLKPNFFSNELMAENNPLGRLLFLGMTTLADYKGDLEWRPKRIKVQILPYDECSVTKLAINLEQSRFIRFYSDGVKVYVHIENFTKHQNPHKNERAQGSDIPEFSETLTQAVDLTTLTIKTEIIAINPEENGTAPAVSLLPLTDSLSKTTLTGNEDLPVDNFPPGPTLVPEDYKPPAVVITKLRMAGKTDVDPNDLQLIAKFISHHQGAGTCSPDWDAKFLNWCLREYKGATHETTRGNLPNGGNSTRGQRVEAELRAIALRAEGVTDSGDGSDSGDVLSPIPAQVGFRD